MELIVIGTNHQQVPVEIREKFSLTSGQQTDLLTAIAEDDLKEGVVISTCNRTEVYLIAEEREQARQFGEEKLAELADIKETEVIDYLYQKIGLAAVNHLYRVAGGLDSLVVGEVQILNQLKTAFKQAKQQETVGNYLHRLFTAAFRVGKRARTETEISENAASVSYVAVELARKIFGSLAGETVLILGAGETSELTLKNLVEYGVEGVMVANRTYERGQELARQFNGRAVTWDQLDEWVREVDIVISSTGAPHYVLQKETVQQAEEETSGPLFLIDIAVPRDIDPASKQLPGVHLYDIDDLEELVEENMAAREAEIEQVEAIIEEEIIEFKQWLNNQQCVPLIKQMRKRAEGIKQEELERALNQLEAGDKEPEAIINQLADRLVNKVLHSPTVGIKELANSDNCNQKLEVARKLFTEAS